jgi:putative heme iron utilization protein
MCLIFLKKWRNEKSIQHSFDSVTTSKKVESVELPVVLTDDEAKKIAMILRDDYHLSENEISCSLPINYLDCLPGDTFTTTIDNVGYTLRITEKRVSLENRIIELKCTLEDLDIYSNPIRELLELDYYSLQMDNS